MLKIKSLINSSGFASFVVKTGATIIIWVIALVPFWLYLLTRMLVNPIGFWQELAILAIFAIVIGWLQALLIIFGAALNFVVLTEGL